MEDSIMHEANMLCNLYESQEGKPFDPNQTMNVFVVNALWAILTGERFESDDPRAKKIAELVDLYFKYAISENQNL